MKTIRALWLTLIAISMTLASTALAGPEGQIGVGKRVAAMWTNGGYFLGTVTGIEGDRFDILFEDGDRLAVSAGKVVPLTEDTSFAVGDHVVAAWKGISMYPGVVTKVHAKSCMVKWDDGDEPLLVARDKIFHANKMIAAAGFNVGDHVMATWKNSQKYPGVVAEVRGDACLIKWDDGDEPLWVSRDQINTMADTRRTTFNVGDHVMATWKNSQKYPGVVAEVRGDACLIKWDDGDEPLWVSRDQINTMADPRRTTFNVGDHVAAMWKDSRYYPGVVAEVRGNESLIKWDDGDAPMFVSNNLITHLTRTQAAIFKVGDHVMATWKDSHMYPGVVAGILGDICLIKWDDGDEPMMVAKEKIIPFSHPQAASPSTTRPSLQRHLRQ